MTKKHSAADATTRTVAFGSKQRPVNIGKALHIAKRRPLVLESGATLRDIPIAYQTYGSLNADRSNAILICHALTGDQFVASRHPVTGKPGWWETYVGPGKPIDTDRYYVICSNVLGGCMGSFGPKDINPDTDVPYGLDFPMLTIGDMVQAQARLLDALEISHLHAVVGGSMGGMQVLEWCRLYPDRVARALVLASTSRHSAQNIAFHEIGRQAIMADPAWKGGRYMQEGSYPASGLAVARMAAHVTYLSEEAMHQKFGRKLQDRESVSFGFEADFQVESYLRHQGKGFVERFDPNSYLYITRAMDYFDMAAAAGGRLADVFHDCDTRFCIITFSTDWLFPPSESRHIVQALNAVAANVSYVELESDKGHDAFLLPNEGLVRTIDGFLGR